jgi:polyferredoxin
MDKVNKPRGLIRYASLNAIRNGHARWLTPRIAAYGGVWLVLVAVVTTLFMLRSDIEVTLLRQEGSVWITTTEGIGNYYRVEIINKTSNTRNITFDVSEPKGAIVKPLIDATNVKPWSELKGRLLVIVPPNSIQNGVGKVTIRAREGNTTVKSETTSFLTAQQGGTP